MSEGFSSFQAFRIAVFFGRFAGFDACADREGQRLELRRAHLGVEIDDVQRVVAPQPVV